jgi:hypothetical protein
MPSLLELRCRSPSNVPLVKALVNAARYNMCSFTIKDEGGEHARAECYEVNQKITPENKTIIILIQEFRKRV